MKNLTITVLGAGYVGLTSAVLFARAGFKVFLIEPNPERLSAIKAGHSFFYEQGINELIEKALKSSLLIPTDSYAESIPSSDVIFSCVGTPDNKDGSPNLSYLYSAAESSLQYAKNGAIYVQKSTVPVGTGQQIITHFNKKPINLKYVSNPEFLREGTAIADTLFFDRIVVGGDDAQSLQIVSGIYRKLEQNREKIAEEAGVTGPEKPGRYITTDLNSAELTKVTANAFLALKISFANSIAKLADQAGADVKAVMEAVGSDSRIGSAFLNAGRGYGGGCFPKDISGLLSSAESFGIDLDIIEAVQSINESMPQYVIDKIEAIHGDISNTSIAVLGLAFKAGTSDVRRSPGIAIANLLNKKGARVHVYDPEANKEAAHELADTIAMHESLDDAINDTNIVLVATDWPEFTRGDITHLVKGNTRVFVDAMNAFEPNMIRNLGVEYIGIGRE